ncbi:MAG: hypothetical protein ACJAUD_000222 [Crocinitomicaceae bacterium]|jgi:hypothetical protein
MKYAIEQIHLIAQYLSAAGICFLDKKEDDSHTNLGWDAENKRLATHPFGTGNHQVGLNLASLKLEWLNNGEATSTIDFQSTTHSEILNWFKMQVEKHSIGAAYQYDFHYELPYPSISENDTFIIDPTNSLKFAEELSTAQTSFETFLSENDLKSPIRVWPHHFDLGIYTQLDSSGSVFLAAGLAVADTLVDGLYYYAAGYKDGEEIVTESFSGLDKGDWRSNWNGATLASEGISVEVSKHFLNQTRETFIKK